MRKLLFILSFIFLILNATQAQEVELAGQIIDKASQEAVPYVHIINKTINKGTVSNTEGRFWVKMDKNDTLLFSAIGFEKYTFTLKEDIKTDKLNIVIEMDMSTMELEAVKVFAYRDEHALKRAIINMDVPLQEDNSIKIPGLRASKFTTGEGGVGISGPFSALGKVFSKEEKEKKALKKYKQEYDYAKLLTTKYNKAVVIKITNIPDDKVEDFMNFCVLEDAFIYRASEYEMAVVLNDCLVDFNKIKDN